mgnify:CR=1 FL=1
MKLTPFKSPGRLLCTCPSKYSLNTYIGRCGHGCVYCYAPKFPSFNGPARPRTKLAETINRMIGATQERLPVMVSDCTDPYQPLEARIKLTRRCLKALADRRFPILVTTKSDLVTRDIDLLSQTSSVVAVTVTTQDDRISKLIEPHAPHPVRRISALRRLARNGIPTLARIDPIIPSVNDDWASFERLVATLKDAGVHQVTVSTLKLVRGVYERLSRLGPSFQAQLRQEYLSGNSVFGYRYLPDRRRREIVQSARRIVLRYGLEFASCREGFPELSTAVCDGTSHLRQGSTATLLDS